MIAVAHDDQLVGQSVDDAARDRVAVRGRREDDRRQVAELLGV